MPNYTTQDILNAMQPPQGPLDKLGASFNRSIYGKALSGLAAPFHAYQNLMQEGDLLPSQRSYNVGREGFYAGPGALLPSFGRASGLGAAGGRPPGRPPGPGYKYKASPVGEQRVLQQDLPTPQKIRDFWDAMDRNKGSFLKTAEDLNIRDVQAAARARSDMWRRPAQGENLEDRFNQQGNLFNLTRQTEPSSIEKAFHQLRGQGFSEPTIRHSLETEFGVKDTEDLLSKINQPIASTGKSGAVNSPQQVQDITDQLGLEFNAKKSKGMTTYIKVRDPESGKAVEVRVPSSSNPHSGSPRQWLIDTSEAGKRNPTYSNLDLSGQSYGDPATLESKLRYTFGKYPPEPPRPQLPTPPPDPKQLKLLSTGFNPFNVFGQYDANQ